MVSRAYIQDEVEDIRLTVLSDRAHGVSSQQDGQMEVFMNTDCWKTYLIVALIRFDIKADLLL